MTKKAKKGNRESRSVTPDKMALEEQKLLEDMNETPKQAPQVSDDASVKYELEMMRIRARWNGLP